MRKKHTLLRKRSRKNNKPAHNNKTSEFDVFMVHRILKSCYTIAIASQLINDLQITDGWIVMLHRQILFYFPFFPVCDPQLNRTSEHTYTRTCLHSNMYRVCIWHIPDESSKYTYDHKSECDLKWSHTVRQSNEQPTRKSENRKRIVNDSSPTMCDKKWLK